LSERALTEGVEGSYVSTTSADDPLDHIKPEGLGVGRFGLVNVGVTPAGVVIDRTGAPGLLVPATALTDVRVESMRAGKAAPHGLLVVEWHLGDRAVATAFRPREPKDRETLMRSIRALIARRDAA
jgi:hypothetical protein